MSKYAVKCEKTTTFYIDVIADTSWEAQNKAEYIHSMGEQGGYCQSEDVVKALSAVEISNADGE